MRLKDEKQQVGQSDFGKSSASSSPDDTLDHVKWTHVNLVIGKAGRQRLF